MKALAVLLLFLLIPFSYALNPIEADTMEARVLIANTVTLNPTGSRYHVAGTTGTLTWFPRENSLQEVTSMRIDPAAEQEEERIVFDWTRPQQSNTLVVEATVRTRNAIIPVREKVAFPLQDIPPDVALYLEEGEITDQNAQIQRLAQELAAGKTDAYEVVFTLADWTTTNVEYSLASAGQPAIQTSSEVLQSREGKCDELTALFISLNRAVGIPARFVAGYSYTTSDKFTQPWGGHGWAEVWLPGQGWIPFDPTYGEYGYLDAGHVTLKVSPDAKETSIDYTAQGSDFDLVTEPLDITVTPTKLTQQENTDISIRLSAPYTRVGFGSAVLVLAEVTNERDYYVSTRLDLAKTANSELLSGTYRNILLKPYERRTVAFLAKIDDDLKSGYRYTFPFRVYSRLGPDATIKIEVEEDAPVYEESMFSQYEEQSEQAPSFGVVCDKGTAAYAGEPIAHECKLLGAGRAQVCEGRECFQAEESFTITTMDEKPGVYTRTYTAKASETIKFYVTSRTVAPSELVVTFDAPATATPDDLVKVRANIKSSGAIPKNVTIRLQAHHSMAEQHVDDLARPAAVIFSLPGDALRPGKNDVELTIGFHDEVGTPRSETYSVPIELTGVTITDRIMFWMEDAGQAVIGLF
jgi:transglutaminase-like putative cysteine protease